MGDRLATIDMGRKVDRGCCGGASMSWIKLFSKTSMHRILELELDIERTNNDCAVF